ncbi:membrane or secreted protein [Altibacter sp. HG106]|uniref:membrane or secreted protein n=1 Tax=Altibacter sp. HG106 TaxID=3023937 RepID=UPI00235039D6|nr:membrane or secreted protein [Altibacter sp. HG106]MDC7995654.1 membrane or secreted protein [Altibacter sp. HG106]
MRIIPFVLLLLFTFNSLPAQSILGAWERSATSEEGIPLTQVVIFADGFQVVSTYHTNDGTFVNTQGGTWSLAGSTMTETVEFDTHNPEAVGTTKSFQIQLSKESLTLPEANQTWKRIDDGTPGALQGAWLMSGRIREGELQQRDTNRPRKTMKMVSGTRFQWIAYNTETKQFMGTGGGTYTTSNGTYTETIAFFSRDNSRVGRSLPFEYELIDGNWHHAGLSSKGDPIHEIWSLRKPNQ